MTGLARRMVPKACELACIVRDEGRLGVERFAASLDPAEVTDLLAVLAAMVPVEDASPGDLLAWTGGLDAALEWRQEPLPFGECRCRDLEPCGTRAAYVRHKRRGEPVDVACDRFMKGWRARQYQKRKARKAAGQRGEGVGVAA